MSSDPMSLDAEHGLSAGEPIVFGAPRIESPEIEEVVDTLRSGWLGTGPKTRQFEHQFSDYVDAAYAVATNSGTAAMHLALDALEIGPGDEVITTPLTFAATANVIEHTGARPVFADVRPEDGNIDPAAVAAAVTDRTRAIMPVHYAGAVADVPALRRDFADIPLVVDAAHAIESEYPDGMSSAAGGATAVAYSFYVTKNLVTGEGGMLATDDEEVARRARVRGLHGLDRDAWKRYSTSGTGIYRVEYPGYKYNMTDIQASLGIHQLARIEKYHERRRQVWAIYNDAFSELPGIDLLPVSLRPDDSGRHARHLYTVLCDWLELGIDRITLVERLREAGIGTGWHFPALHLEPWYSERYGFKPGMFPVAESIANRTLSLPLSAALHDSEVERVASVFSSIVRSDLRQVWGRRFRPRRASRTRPEQVPSEDLPVGNV